jgi:hypothetical protein
MGADGPLDSGSSSRGPLVPPEMPQFSLLSVDEGSGGFGAEGGGGDSNPASPSSMRRSSVTSVSSDGGDGSGKPVSRRGSVAVPTSSVAPVDAITNAVPFSQQAQSQSPAQPSLQARRGSSILRQSPILPLSDRERRMCMSLCLHLRSHPETVMTLCLGMTEQVRSFRHFYT